MGRGVIIFLLIVVIFLVIGGIVTIILLNTDSNSNKKSDEFVCGNNICNENSLRVKQSDFTTPPPGQQPEKTVIGNLEFMANDFRTDSFDLNIINNLEKFPNNIQIKEGLKVGEEWRFSRINIRVSDYIIYGDKPGYVDIIISETVDSCPKDCK